MTTSADDIAKLAVMEDVVDEVYFPNESISHMDSVNVEIIAFPIYLGLIGVLGLVGNGILIWVIVSSKEMRNIIVNILVVNLAVTYVIFIFTNIPFTSTYIALGSWPFGEVYCKAENYLRIGTICSVMYSLVLTSIDRFLVAVFPTVSKRVCTVRNTYVAILVQWFLILSCCLPITFVPNIHTLRDTVHCDFIHDFEYSKMSIFVISFVIPLIAVIFCSVFAIIRQWRPTGEETVARAEKHITCLVAIMASAVFIIRLLEIIINFIFYLSVMSHPALHAIADAVFALQYLTILVNPVLYAIVWKKFPETFRSLSYRYRRLQEQSAELMTTEMGPFADSNENED